MSTPTSSIANPPAQTSARRAWFPTLLATLGLLVSSAHAGWVPRQSAEAAGSEASATTEPDRANPKLVDLRVRVGFQNQLIPERWTPVWIDLTPPAGKPSQGGTLAIEYTQDATQRTRIVLDVATTPGRTSRICVPVCVPTGIASIVVSFAPDRGRPVSYSMGYSGDRQFDARLPNIADPGGLQVAVVGTVPIFVPMAVSRWTAVDPQARLTSPSTVQNCGPEFLPPVASAYEGLSVLVVPAELARTLEPRVLAAIRHWVASGGRLVLAAWIPGDAWRMWLPPGENGNLAILAEARPGSLPAALHESVVKRSHELELASTLTLSPSAPIVAPTEPGASLAVPPKLFERSSVNDRPPVEVVQRPISLTAEGVRTGWKLRWTLEGESDGGTNSTAADDEEPQRGLIAEGPVGLGFVTIIGVNPVNVTSSPSIFNASAAYEAALLGILNDVPVASSTTDQSTYWYSVAEGSGAGKSARLATKYALDYLSEAPLTPIGLFWLIGASMAVLALLLGPGDYFLLGRLRRATGGMRHRSHLTALLWIGIATIVSYIGPAVFRSSESRVKRLSVIDAVMPAGSLAGIARQTSLTGVWAGASSDAAFVEPPETASSTARVAPGWWRGVSPLGFYERSGDSLNTPTIVYGQRSAQVVSNDSVFGGYARGAEGANTVQTDADGPANRPGGLALDNWTFRGLEDSATVAVPVRTRVIRSGGKIEVAIDGVPAGATPEMVALRTGKTWLRVDLKPDGSRSWRGPATEDASEIQIHRPDGQPAFVNKLEWTFNPSAVEASSPNVVRYGWGSQSQPWTLQGSALNLTDTQRRNLGMEARLKSGNWAVVCLTLTGMPPDVQITRPRDARSSRTVVLRIATPIENRGGLATPTTPPEPSTPPGNP